MRVLGTDWQICKIGIIKIFLKNRGLQSVPGYEYQTNNWIYNGSF